jgi:hypothetical protein
MKKDSFKRMVELRKKFETPRKQFIEITLLRLIKKHDLPFIPKRITISKTKDRIFLWKE